MFFQFVSYFQMNQECWAHAAAYLNTAWCPFKEPLDSLWTTEKQDRTSLCRLQYPWGGRDLTDQGGFTRVIENRRSVFKKKIKTGQTSFCVHLKAREKKEEKCQCSPILSGHWANQTYGPLSARILEITVNKWSINTELQKTFSASFWVINAEFHIMH